MERPIDEIARMIKPQSHKDHEERIACLCALCAFVVNFAVRY